MTVKLHTGETIWSNKFKLFNAKVFVPQSNLPGDIINFGFSAPYFLIFIDNQISDTDAKAYADSTGLSKIAADFDTSIVFINPTNEGGWKNAPLGIFEQIIENSKIHQYHKDGYAILESKFFNTNDGFAIRGAIFRSCIIAKDGAADYVAKNLLKPINGAGLWGPADVTPTVCFLENLSVLPEITRRNMPIVSIANSKEINDKIKADTNYSYFQEKADFTEAYYNFARQFKRWGWVGDLEFEPDFEKLNMKEEYGIVELKTSDDNSGDDAGTKTHKVGYLSYYNKDLFTKGPAPLVLCFHGGGDSAKHIAQVSAWYKVCHDHNFLLVCIENHLNSTATEMMELLEIIKSKYRIDETRIYGTGFSMGGCKTWDLYQEYPEVFAALAPMDATWDVGCNFLGKPSAGLHHSGKINQNIMVPIFYAGGEATPLPELPFQDEKCRGRMEYVLKVNDCKTEYNVKYEDKENWKDKIWGISGDKIQKITDDARKAILTLNFFESRDGNYYSVFGSVSEMGHECRYHTCEYAYRFMSQFQRASDGKIKITNNGKGDELN